jgi:hypothetical protein
MADPIRRIHTATCVLGVPGSGKTSLLGGFAEYLWETYQRVLLLYSWDGGAIPTGVQKLMKQGLIRFWRVRTRSALGLGIETLYLATKGYWPRTINPETGETTPAVDLVPPVTARYLVTCPAGHLLASLPTRNAITPTYCMSCKELIQFAQLQVAESVARTRGFERVGGVAFDGLTSMTGVVMEHMDHARGQGQIGGEKPAFGGVVVSGSIKLGGNNRADVGFGQTRGQQFVNNSLSIPDLVEGPVFTALAMEATDEGGLPIVGPKLPGRAATDEASAWFGNVFEMGKTTDERDTELFTLFLRPFTDPQGRRHLLKTSASPTGLPDKLVDPHDTPWSQASLGLVFAMLDADLARALAEKEIPGAPGLHDTPTTYGETFHQAPPPPVLGDMAPASAATPAVPPAAAAASPAAPTPTARRRPRAEAAAAPAPPAAGPSPASPPPPPPPGMKPPARVPTTATVTTAEPVTS